MIELNKENVEAILFVSYSIFVFYILIRYSLLKPDEEDINSKKLKVLNKMYKMDLEYNEELKCENYELRLEIARLESKLEKYKNKKKIENL